MLQCEDDPTFIVFGTKDRPGRLGISVRDFARFGLLYLRQGDWRGKQLISPEHATMAVTSPVPDCVPRTEGKRAEIISGQRSDGGGDINITDHLGSYSFAWWINGVDCHGNLHWPDASKDTYGAFVPGRPCAMVVIPSLHLVVTWNDANVRNRETVNEALKLLIEACSTAPNGSSCR